MKRLPLGLACGILLGAAAMAGGQVEIQRGWSAVSGGLLRWPLGTLLVEEAANRLAQRNGTNSQAFRVYNTYTGTDDEFGGLVWGGNILRLRTDVTGGGTNRAIDIIPGGSSGWNFAASTGHLTALGDNTQNIGARNDTRPREVVAGSDMVAGMVIANTSLQLGGVASLSTVLLFTPVLGTTGGMQGVIIQQADGTPALFADLNGAATNGAMIYCSDCTIASPCAGGGAGAIAKRLNGSWICN